MRALLLNYTNLGIRVYDPASGEFRQYANGKLEIDDGDPCYAAVVAEGRANPDTNVFIDGVAVSEAIPFACDVCRPAQVFDTDQALYEHTKLVHMTPPVLNDEGVVEEGAPGRARRPRGNIEGIPPATAGRSG